MTDTPSLSDRLRQAIEASLPAVQAKTEDDNDRAEEKNLIINHAKETLEGLKEDNLNKKANRELRWRYARWVFTYLVVFSLFSSIVVLLHGFKVFGFTLPDVALGALVGSTAVSAIGLVAAVVNGLFKS